MTNRKGFLMKRPTYPLNEDGMTLLEIMFALAVLGLGAYLTIEGVSQMRDMSKTTLNMSSTERQITMIVDNIRTSLGQYQINYDSTPEAKQTALDLAKLPMEWDPGVERPVTADCLANKQKCLGGRYGFVVQPLDDPRGLYSVTLRMTHREWREPFRDYEFLVTVQ
jgi:prepilin-type N-terminal cleavage/methylation domain-containing protein